MIDPAVAFAAAVADFHINVERLMAALRNAVFAVCACDAADAAHAAYTAANQDDAG